MFSTTTKPSRALLPQLRDLWSTFNDYYGDTFAFSLLLLRTFPLLSPSGPPYFSRLSGSFKSFPFLSFKSWFGATSIEGRG
mmetsp:Transcript_9021/g.6360  ORF Transcript_9021/g.6360 Transcript_9021/m.6360 type:complete len:81 (+) Transcript_9021:365-607(+)